MTRYLDYIILNYLWFKFFIINTEEYCSLTAMKVEAVQSAQPLCCYRFLWVTRLQLNVSKWKMAIFYLMFETSRRRMKILFEISTERMEHSVPYFKLSNDGWKVLFDFFSIDMADGTFCPIFELSKGGWKVLFDFWNNQAVGKTFQNAVTTSLDAYVRLTVP